MKLLIIFLCIYARIASCTSGFVAQDGGLAEEEEAWAEVIPVGVTYTTRHDDGGTLLDSRALTTNNTNSLFPSVVMEATVMSLEPRNFLKWRINDYLKAIGDYIKETTGDITEVSMISVHGEDGGTGVLTEVTWLTGGLKAAKNFRKNVLTDWDKVQTMLPAYPFGKGCHMEGYSWPCVTKQNGLDPSKEQVAKYGLKPSLQLWVALPKYHPEDVTAEIEDKVNFYVKEALKPAEAVVTSDWFVDDNDEAVKYGAKVKPVFNIQAESQSLAALDKLQEKIRLMMSGNLSTYDVWPRSSGLGKVHIEGETTTNPHFCYRGDIPVTIQNHVDYYKNLTSPPPSQARQLGSCQVVSTSAYDTTDALIRVAPGLNSKSCSLTLTEEDNPSNSLSWKIMDLSYPVTTYPIGGLDGGKTYLVSVECAGSDNQRTTCIPKSSKIVTPPNEQVPSIVSVTQIPPNGGQKVVVSVVPPQTSGGDCEQYTVTVKDENGKVLQTVDAQDYSATIDKLFPGQTYTITARAQCGQEVVLSPVVQYTPLNSTDTVDVGGPPPPPIIPTPYPISVTVNGQGACKPVLFVDSTGLKSTGDVGEVFVTCPEANGSEKTYAMGTFNPGGKAYVPLYWAKSTGESITCIARATVGSQSDETSFTIPANCQGTQVYTVECLPDKDACVINVHPEKSLPDTPALPPDSAVPPGPPGPEVPSGPNGTTVARCSSEPEKYKVVARAVDGPDAGSIVATLTVAKSQLNNIYVPNLKPGVVYEFSVQSVCTDGTITDPVVTTIPGFEPSKQQPPPPVPSPPPPQVNVDPQKPLSCSSNQMNAYATGPYSGIIEFEPKMSGDYSCQVLVTDPDGNTVFNQWVPKGDMTLPNASWGIYAGLDPGFVYAAKIECTNDSGSRCSNNMGFKTPAPSQIHLNNLHPGPELFGGNVKSNCANVLVTLWYNGKEVASQVVDRSSSSGSKFSIPFKEPRTSWNESMCAIATGIDCPQETESECYQVPFNVRSMSSPPPPPPPPPPSPPPPRKPSPSPKPQRPSPPPPSPPPPPPPPPPLTMSLAFQSLCQPTVQVTMNANQAIAEVQEDCGQGIKTIPGVYLQSRVTTLHLDHQKPGQTCNVTVTITDPTNFDRSTSTWHLHQLPSSCVDEPIAQLTCKTDTSRPETNCDGKITQVPDTCTVKDINIRTSVQTGISAPTPSVTVPLSQSQFQLTGMKPGTFYTVHVTADCEGQLTITHQQVIQTPPFIPPPPPPPPPNQQQYRPISEICEALPSLFPTYFRGFGRRMVKSAAGVCRWQHGGGHGSMCCHCPATGSPWKDCSVFNPTVGKL